MPGRAVFRASAYCAGVITPLRAMSLISLERADSNELKRKKTTTDPESNICIHLDFFRKLVFLRKIAFQASWIGLPFQASEGGGRKIQKFLLNCVSAFKNEISGY